MVAIDATHTLIPRWPGHGDLTVLVARDLVYLRADQVERLAGIPPWSGGEALIPGDWYLHNDREYYPLDDAIARCESDTSTAAAEFLSWLRPTLEELLTDEVLDLAHRIPGFIGSYTVRRAAEILNTDPAITIGQNTLFAHLNATGWTERTPNGDWTMTSLARRNGWLTHRDVTVPAATKTGKRPYGQLYVTPAGLTELRRCLHAIGRDPTGRRSHPTLFD